MALLAVAIASAARPASADAMKCGTRWIDAGAPLADVIEHCGPPTRVQALRGLWRGPPGELWIYDRGRTWFTMILLVSRLNVVWVATGSYGATAP